MQSAIKKHNTIGCCGIDCGLCPRFYTKGDSVCPGCGGDDFKNKHPSCGFLTCCAIKNRCEVCSHCNEYPCVRFEAEKEGYDSFVSHRKVFDNQEFIKNCGIEKFIVNQKRRMDILRGFLSEFDDGRSKSFYCISCTLLPENTLKEIHEFSSGISPRLDLKDRCKMLKKYISETADRMGIDLKLRKKH